MRSFGPAFRNFQPEILDDILKTDRIARIGIDQSLVGLEDCEPLLIWRGPGDTSLVKGRRQRRGGLGLDLKEVIQTEAFKKREIAGVRSHHPEQAAFQITKTESHGSQSAHEGRIHEFALLEIENEIVVTLGNHALHKFLHALRILKSAATFEFHPNSAIFTADEDG